MERDGARTRWRAHGERHADKKGGSRLHPPWTMVACCAIGGPLLVSESALLAYWVAMACYIAARDARGSDDVTFLGATVRGALHFACPIAIIAISWARGERKRSQTMGRRLEDGAVRSILRDAQADDAARQRVRAARNAAVSSATAYASMALFAFDAMCVAGSASFSRSGDARWRCLMAFEAWAALDSTCTLVYCIASIASCCGRRPQPVDASVRDAESKDADARLLPLFSAG